MIKTDKIQYKDRYENTFEGVIAYDDSIDTTRPVVLVSHAFSGQSKFEENKAIELAKLGYIGFAIDVYGQGKRAQNPEEAQKLMDFLNNDRKLLLDRMLLSLEKAKQLKYADITKVGAIGFCFGGKCVLDLARSGETISGVVSFHGLYDAPSFNPNQKISTPILVLHGWDDPLALPSHTVSLAEELTQKDANWEVNAYGKTGHAFTNPNAKFPEKGLVFNQRSNDRAWQRMVSFFESVFL